MIKYLLKKIGRFWIYMDNHCTRWAMFHEN